MKLHILILCFLIQLVSCQKNTKNNDFNGKSNKQETTSKVNFINYPIDELEGITSTQYDGIYRNFDFKYRDGETTFMLVPKIGSEKWYLDQKNKIQNPNLDADSIIEKNLNKWSFKDLSKEFNIWIFHTPKEFLKATPGMDAPYVESVPAKIFLYQYNSTSDRWEISDTFSINNDNDKTKAQEWRESKISGFVTKEIKTTSLDNWTGIYINSDDQNISTYKEIKDRIGWYEVKITKNKITYINDTRMESEFPSEAPGGYSINYDCDYNISGNTLKLYEKNENDTSPSKNVSGNGQKLILKLTKKENKYYGESVYIDAAENLTNSAREKSKRPYLFYKFDITTTH